MGLSVTNIVVLLFLTALQVGDSRSKSYESFGSVANTCLEIFMIFHILCNFLTIALSYRCCDSLLLLCCGCLRCCTVIPITTEDHDAIFLEQIMMNARNGKDGVPQHIEHEPPSTRVQPSDTNQCNL